MNRLVREVQEQRRLVERRFSLDNLQIRWLGWEVGAVGVLQHERGTPTEPFMIAERGNNTALLPIPSSQRDRAMYCRQHTS